MKFWLFILLTTLKLTTYSKVRQYSFNEQCKKATEIFTGHVVRITVLSEQNFEYTTYRTFRIVFVTDKIWKGSVSDTMVCIANEGICSPNIFELDKKFLVYSKNDTITLGSGRSGDMKFDFIRAETRKLSIRYLFRRPEKIIIDKRLTVYRGTRQPITRAKT